MDPNITALVAAMALLVIRELVAYKRESGLKGPFNDDDKKKILEQLNAIYEVLNPLKDLDINKCVWDVQSKLSVIGEVDPETGLLRAWEDKRTSRRDHENINHILSILDEITKILRDSGSKKVIDSVEGLDQATTQLDVQIRKLRKDKEREAQDDN